MSVNISVKHVCEKYKNVLFKKKDDTQFLFRDAIQKIDLDVNEGEIVFVEKRVLFFS